MRDIYVMPENGGGAPQRAQTHEDCLRAQEKGWGVFWAVNEFDGPRKAENCSRILSFFCEFDGLDKTHQMEIIEYTLPPSLVVESKRGYHVYWDAVDCTLEAYKEVQSRIVYHFGADEKAALVTQLARVPGYYHLKDPNDPFLVSEVFRTDARYSPEIMLYYFDPLPEVEENAAPYIPKAFNSAGGNLTESLDRLNNEDALLRLSGTSYVMGEVYSFRPVAGGKKNLKVNGKGTSVFIDAEGRIGSTSGGGPTLWQYLKWYGRSDQEVYRIIRTVFPELFQGEGK